MPTEDPAAAAPSGRERVLQVALEHFAAHGFRGASIARIAAEAGLSQSGLLHHYPSKAELLGAALAHRDTTSGLELHLDELRGWAVFEGMARVVERNTATADQVRLFTTLVAEALGPEHPAHPWVVRHYDLAALQLRRGAVEAVADGELLPDAPVETITASALALMDGLQVQWLLRGGPDAPAGGRSVDMVGAFREHLAQVLARWGAGAGRSRAPDPGGPDHRGTDPRGTDPPDLDPHDPDPHDPDPGDPAPPAERRRPAATPTTS